jgi:hypothetical protein
MCPERCRPVAPACRRRRAEPAVHVLGKEGTQCLRGQRIRNSRTPHCGVPPRTQGRCYHADGQSGRIRPPRRSPWFVMLLGLLILAAVAQRLMQNSPEPRPVMRIKPNVAVDDDRGGQSLVRGDISWPRTRNPASTVHWRCICTRLSNWLRAPIHQNSAPPSIVSFISSAPPIQGFTDCTLPTA